jgi:hypothetical protein
LNPDRLSDSGLRESIESRVYGILDRIPGYIWDGETLPVPVDDIVSDVYGLRVKLEDDMTRAPGLGGERNENVSGLLLVARGEIWVNAAEAHQWEGRRRFTIGHELGHHVLHQEDSRPAIFCRKVEVEDDRPETEQAPVSAEREADAFAAAMLMPEHLVRAEVERNGIEIANLCAVFGTSEKATKYRIETFFGPLS